MVPNKGKNRPKKPVRSPARVAALVEENIRLAHYFALKHEKFYPDRDVLLSEAMRGLHRAAEMWRKSSKVPFGSYASLRIKWLYNRLFNPPRSERRGTEAVVLSMDWERDGSNTWHEMLEDHGASPKHDSDLSEQALASVSGLPARDRKVLWLRFGLGGGAEHTLEEVSAKLGLTRERVRQLELKALARVACAVKGLPFSWDHKRHRCPSLGERQPASGGASKDRGPSASRKAAYRRRMKLENSR